jgi:hypothetical protein
MEFWRFVVCLYISLKYRPSKACVRRVYVRETVIVPNDTQTMVPVRMPFASLRM